MKYCVLALFTLFFWQSAYAQNPLVLTVDATTKPYSGIQAFQEFKIELTDNNPVTPRIIKWKRIDECEMPDAWSAVVCDCNVCHNQYTYASSCTLNGSCSMVFTYSFNFGAIITNHSSTLLFYDALDSLNTVNKLTLSINNGCVLSNSSQEHTIKVFSIYPNPCHDILYFKTEVSDQLEQCIVKDILGKTVLTTNFKEAKFGLNVSSLLSGFYSLQVLNAKHDVVANQKFWKQ